MGNGESACLLRGYKSEPKVEHSDKRTHNDVISERPKHMPFEMSDNIV